MNIQQIEARTQRRTAFSELSTDKRKCPALLGPTYIGLKWTGGAQVLICVNIYVLEERNCYPVT